MALKTENLDYTVDGKTILSLPKPLEINQHTLILGASGSGKTTLLNLLGGLLRPTKGSVSFMGDTYSEFPQTALDRFRARHFGFIFQRLHLIPFLTVTQNVQIAGQYGSSALEALGLANKSFQKAKTLSQGEAQRVAIARAMANQPAVIFADEPTSALDDENADAVMKLLLNQAKQTKALLVVATHDARIKPHFKKVITLANGTLK